MAHSAFQVAAILEQLQQVTKSLSDPRVTKRLLNPQRMEGASSGMRRAFWQELLLQAVAVGGLIMSMRLVMKYLDPYREQREASKKRSAFLKRMLGKNLDLNEFEQLLAASVVNPKDIDVSVDDVSGLDDLIQELEVKVLMPMMQPELYCTTLWKPTRGVLLYGPPGTGKTMLAKALAKHSGCYFLNVQPSAIMSKWLGDANRLVRAIFTLADKLQPCIIFIDEVDAMLGKRGHTSEHEASLQVKTEFMQLWDGMESTRGQRIVVMGATNRPSMVDEAVLRRFSIQHEVGLPDQDQRAAILKTYLRRHNSELSGEGVSPIIMDNRPIAPGGPGALDWIAEQTDGFSGSDLMELCAQAAQRALAEFLLSQQRRPQQTAGSSAGRAGSRAAGRKKGATGSPAGPKDSAGSNSSSGRSGSLQSASTSSLSGGRGQRGSSGSGEFYDASEEANGGVSGSGGGSRGTGELRALGLEDFRAVLRTMRPSTVKAEEYNKKSLLEGEVMGGGGGGNVPLGAVLELLARLSAGSPSPPLHNAGS